MSSEASVQFPQKRDVFGVPVSVTTYDELVKVLVRAGHERRSAVVDFMPVHGLVQAATDASFRQRIEAFDVVAPDGQPVRWALNRMHGAGLVDRVYGPELTLRLCRAASREGLGVYLYGSTEDVLGALTRRLRQWYPGIRIAGAESPPFRELTPEEDEQVVRRINDSGAAFVFISLGAPRQEIFAHEHRERIRAVQLCVGAAFDFHAGSKPMAPGWMQKRGLEWLFRLATEPRRLWKRYLFTNTVFLSLAARRLLLGR